MSCNLNTNFRDILRNDSFGEKTITIENTAGPIDLTGCLIRAQFRRGLKIGEVAKTIDETNGIDIFEPTAGQFKIEDFIVDWEPDIYFYDVQFTFTSGSVKTYFGGSFKVIQDVTQNP